MSNFGKKLAVTGQRYIPTVIGEQYGGGYYAGRLKVDGQAYVVIVSPKSTETTLAYSTTASNTTGLISRWDGDANMSAVVSDNIANFPASQWCKGLTAGGYSDWVLPAEDQLDLCYRAFRPANAYNGNYGENPSADPPLGNYSVAPSPPATTLPLFIASGSEKFELDFYLTSTIGSTAGAVNVITFNGGSRGNSATNGLRKIRAVRMERVRS